MPIYEYQCHDCRSAFETLVLNAQDTETVQCPKCASSKVERLLSCFSTSCGTESSASSGCNPKPGGFS